MSAHTPEPWHATSYDVLSEAGVVANMAAKRGMPDAANAARIVACVNACRGMDDPVAIISGLHIARETLLTIAKQRDELAAALVQAEACMSIVKPRSDKAEYLRILGVVRAALAKVKE